MAASVEEVVKAVEKDAAAAATNPEVRIRVLTLRWRRGCGRVACWNEGVGESTGQFGLG
jgi:hypothetical protein